MGHHDARVEGDPRAGQLLRAADGFLPPLGLLLVLVRGRAMMVAWSVLRRLVGCASVCGSMGWWEGGQSRLEESAR